MGLPHRGQWLDQPARREDLRIEDRHLLVAAHVVAAKDPAVAEGADADDRRGQEHQRPGRNIHLSRDVAQTDTRRRECHGLAREKPYILKRQVDGRRVDPSGKQDRER